MWDQRQLRKDDIADSAQQTVDRLYWVQRSSEATIQLADAILGIINHTASPPQQLNYVKHYIGRTDGARSRNFIYMLPRRRFLRVVIPGGWNEERAARLSDSGIEAKQKADQLVFNLSAGDLKTGQAVIASLIDELVAEQSQ